MLGSRLISELLYKSMGNCMAKKTMELPKDFVEDLFKVSLKFHELIETLEVQMDKATVRRLKIGESEYKQGKYKVASTKSEIDKVLVA